MSLWREHTAREPAPDDMIFLGKSKNGAGPRPMSIKWLNDCLKASASLLFSQGLVQNGDPASWHSHSLRHSFATECSHAQVKPEVREYWLGHLEGITWVYVHPELHRDDLVAEYRKVEPHVSLDYTETILREQYDSREKTLLSKVLELESNYEALKKELAAFRQV
jgi:integrase